jgi:hypothetical protein
MQYTIRHCKLSTGISSYVSKCVLVAAKQKDKIILSSHFTLSAVLGEIFVVDNVKCPNHL